MGDAAGAKGAGAVRLRLNVQAIRDEIGRPVADLAAQADALRPDVERTCEAGGESVAISRAAKPTDQVAADGPVVPVSDVLMVLAAIDIRLERLQAFDHA